MLGTEFAQSVRTALFPLLTLPRTTTFNFSSSHIQLALSRNFIVPTPSVHFAILVASLYSRLPVYLSVALAVKEERSTSGISRHLFVVPTARRCQDIPSWALLRITLKRPVPDRQSTLDKGRKRFLPGGTATKKKVTIVNVWQHTLSFREELGFTFPKCFKYTADRLG